MMPTTEKTKRHKWAKEIHAWAEGKKIQVRHGNMGEWGNWINSIAPTWDQTDRAEYRIKPEPIVHAFCLQYAKSEGNGFVLHKTIEFNATAARIQVKSLDGEWQNFYELG